MPSSLRNQPSSDDQRNVVVATILMAVIMFVWMFYMGPTPAERAGVASQDTVQADPAGTPSTADDPSSAATGTDPGAPSVSSGETDDAAAPPPDPAAASSSASAAASDPVAQAAAGPSRTVVVETDLYTAELSTRGGTLRKFQLNDYLQYNQQDPVQVIDTTSTGALALAFTTPDSRLVDTRSLAFEPSTDADTLRITDANRSLSFTASLGEGTLRYTYTFHPDDYDVGLDIEQTNAASYATRDGYEMIWDGGIPFSEGGTDTEAQSSGIFVYSGGEVESVLLQGDETQETSLNGDISWLSAKNRYFAAVLIPDDPASTRGADLIGEKSPSGNRTLAARLQMPAPAAQQAVDRFHLYMGPLYYNQLAAYERDLYQMVDYGWDFFEWMTRPLATLFFIPALTYLGDFIPYGVVVILMAVFIKMVVYPLTKSSYRSMAQMRDLQPRMQEIKEKHGDDAQKQQEEMMKLYRETGVNPLGGCLPMLLQYPIIIALYQYIPQSIQLRQKSFLWASDLSAPDVILSLPFEIPFYGDYVSGFTLLMGLSMIVTMRLQSTPGQAGAQAKVFMYMMPAVIFFIFNQFASALSLYYLFYNLVTAAQQKWIYYQLDQEKENEQVTAKEAGRKAKRNGANGESKGFFQKLMEKAEEAQKQ